MEFYAKWYVILITFWCIKNTYDAIKVLVKPTKKGVLFVDYWKKYNTLTFYSKMVDGHKYPCYYIEKIKSLDRGAVHISTFRQGQAAAEKEREDRRSLKDGLKSFCWVGREYLPDCHKFYLWSAIVGCYYSFRIFYICIYFIGIFILRNRFAH